MKRIIAGLLMVLATVMSFCAQARTITNITENRTSGMLVSFTLTFSADTTTEWLHMAHGHDVGGDTYSSWEHVEYVAEVNSSTTTLTVPVPADFGPQGSRAIRFFLGEKLDLNYDYDVEYAESNGTAQNGVEFKDNHFKYGQTFTMVWRQASLTGLTDEDKGWGTGSSDNAFTGGGRRNDSKIRPYIKKGHRTLYKMPELTENFPQSALTTDVIYEDKAIAGATISYTMTAMNGSQAGTVWSIKDSLTLASSYDSGENIFIFRGDAGYPYYGKKAIYSVKLTNSDGTVAFNVFPVVKDNVVYFRDLETGTLYGTPNPETDPSLVAGPQVKLRPLPTTVTAMSTVYSSIGKPEIELSTASLCSDYRIKVDYNVLDLGSGASADVYVRYGDTADDLKAVKVAEGVGTGLGSAYLPAVDPNKTYYVRVYAVAGGVTGETSPAQTVVAPALPLEGPGGGNWQGVAISEVTRTAGVQTGVTLEMSNTVDAKLYAAYGATFGGSDTSNWEHVDFVATVSAGTTSYNYTLPQGWGTTIKFVRFFIENDKTATTPFTIYKSLASDASNKQGIQISRHLKGGDTFELVWRQYDTTIKYAEDKAWGTGSGGTNVTGGGRRSTKSGYTDYISPYINSGHRKLYNGTEAFKKADLTTDVTYKDVAVMSVPVSYTMTALDGDDAGKSWILTDSITMPNGLDYDSGSDIYLYRDYKSENWGKKAISSAFLRNKDGLVDFYLIPVKDANDVYCFFDLISGSYLKNLSKTAFIPSAETLTMADFDLVSYSGTAVAEQAGKPALSDDIEVSGTDVGDSVVVSGTLAQAGSGSCTIAVETSSTEDFATYTSFTDGAKTYGAGDAYSITVTTEPGTKVYYRVRATDSSSQAIVSSVGSFTTLGASAAEMKTAPVNTKESVTIVAKVTTVGVGETSVWIEWSTGSETYENKTDAQTFTSASESLDASFTFDVPAYGKLYYRVCCSNTYKTWTFTQTPQPKTGTVVNNANYTWNNAVTEGNWNDAASWTSDGAIASYPNSDSTARFDGTTARVTLTTDAKAKTLTMDGVFDLTFAGAYTLGTSLTVPKTSNWKLQVENTKITSGAFKCYPVTNVLVSVSGSTGAIETSGDFVIAGVSNRIEVATGAHIYPSGSTTAIGGDGTILVLDGGELWGQSFTPGGYVPCTTTPPKVIVKGASALITLWNKVGASVNAGEVAADWEFEVPLTGYNNKNGVIPVPESSNGTPTVPFANWNANGGRQRMAISRNSPFFLQAKGTQTLNQPLVFWYKNTSKGIDTNNIDFVKIPYGGRWYFSYGTSKSNPLWEPAKAGDPPTGIWAELKAKAGLMFIIR